MSKAGRCLCTTPTEKGGSSRFLVPLEHNLARPLGLPWLLGTRDSMKSQLPGLETGLVQKGIIIML